MKLPEKLFIAAVLIGLMIGLFSSVVWSAELTFSQRWRRTMYRDPEPGVASHYNDQRTSSGERLRPWDKSDLTCASPDEPLSTRLRITFEGRSIVCRVNDYGPHPRLSQTGPREKRRKVDLTPAAFQMLGAKLVDGLIPVSIEYD